MKLYELMDTGIADQLRKTAKGIPNKTQSQPGLNPGEDDIPTTGGPTADAGTNGDAMGGPPMGGGAGGTMGGGMGDPMGAGMGGPPMGGPPMGGGMGGPENAPDPAMQEPADPEAEKQEMKKVDDAVMSQVKDLPFAVDYNHEKTKIGPFEILQMDNSDLSELRTICRNKINRIGYTDRYGLYDDPGVQYYTDMLNYVEHVIVAKNEVARSKNPSKKDD